MLCHPEWYLASPAAQERSHLRDLRGELRHGPAQVERSDLERLDRLPIRAKHLIQEGTASSVEFIIPASTIRVAGATRLTSFEDATSRRE